MKWIICSCLLTLVPLQGLIAEQVLQSEVYFSPNPEFFSPLLFLIHQEKELIQIAASRLTDNQIQRALMEASQRGVPIEIILDMKTPAVNKLVKRLYRDNNRIWIYRKVKEKKNRMVMNHKFCICKAQKTVWNGSCSFSPSSKRHCEHALLIRQGDIVKQFGEEFEKLKQKSTLLDKSSFSN